MRHDEVNEEIFEKIQFGVRVLDFQAGIPVEKENNSANELYLILIVENSKEMRIVGERKRTGSSIPKRLKAKSWPNGIYHLLSERISRRPLTMNHRRANQSVYRRLSLSL